MTQIIATKISKNFQYDVDILQEIENHRRRLGMRYDRDVVMFLIREGLEALKKKEKINLEK